ncbi:MAG: hypothetical protein H6934_06475 [Burkholderiaceae bacterium]|nr:hypothetical protein [Burkholderiaceae bacterium]
MHEPIAIDTAPPLDPAQRACLRAIVAQIIPASREFDLPGADDDAILADLVATLDRDGAAVVAALARLDAFAGASFASLDAARQRELAARFRQAEPAHADLLGAVTVRCYYRDDRVMRSLGMEVRPPYPQGFEVDDGDWSLLEPVRSRGRIWREA